MSITLGYLIDKLKENDLYENSGYMFRQTFSLKPEMYIYAMTANFDSRTRIYTFYNSTEKFLNNDYIQFFCSLDSQDNNNENKLKEYIHRTLNVQRPDIQIQLIIELLSFFNLFKDINYFKGFDDIQINVLSHKYRLIQENNSDFKFNPSSKFEIFLEINSNDYFKNNLNYYLEKHWNVYNLDLNHEAWSIKFNIRPMESYYIKLNNIQDFYHLSSKFNLINIKSNVKIRFMCESKDAYSSIMEFLLQQFPKIKDIEL